MAQLTTVGDIKTAVLQHAGELTNGNSPFEQRALDYIQRVYIEILGGTSPFAPDNGEPWVWAKAQNPGVLVLKAPETGTCTLTNGSASGVFAVAPSSSLASRLLRIPGRPEFFRISAHTAASTSFTLDSAYTDSSGSGLAYEAHLLDYSLGASSILRLIEPMRVYRQQVFYEDDEGKIYGVSPDQMSRDYPLHVLMSGVPSRFAQLGESNGIIRVRFNASAITDTRVEYEYIPAPGTLATPDTPLVPLEDRTVLVYGATYYLMFDKNDPRATSFFQLTQSKLQAMMQARRRAYNKTGKNYGRLIPRLDQDNGPALVRSASGLRF